MRPTSAPRAWHRAFLALMLVVGVMLGAALAAPTALVLPCEGSQWTSASLHDHEHHMAQTGSDCDDCASAACGFLHLTAVPCTSCVPVQAGARLAPVSVSHLGAGLSVAPDTPPPIALV